MIVGLAEAAFILLFGGCSSENVIRSFVNQWVLLHQLIAFEPPVCFVDHAHVATTSSHNQPSGLGLRGCHYTVNTVKLLPVLLGIARHCREGFFQSLNDELELFTVCDRCTDAAVTE